MELLLAIGDADGNLLIYCISTENLIRRIKVEENIGIKTVSFSKDAQLIACSTENAHFYLF